ncbi:MAG: hypothetical protein R3F41_07130 [Gammaproteobacteria bacterium]|nr:hypothetical protein [Pseudomonadales bacterium]MCP5348689.1 hypothetical protein [Pseudomonadales bacterium]
MTEYEIAELTFSLIGYGMTAMALYFTVVSGFLIGAYMVGAELSTSQVWIVTSLFVVFAVSLVFGTFSFFAAASSFGESSRDSVEYWLAPVIGVAEFAGIGASLKFMFDIRRKVRTLESGPS